jgi:hypothetical protein
MHPKAPSCPEVSKTFPLALRMTHQCPFVGTGDPIDTKSKFVAIQEKIRVPLWSRRRTFLSVKRFRIPIALALLVLGMYWLGRGNFGSVVRWMDLVTSGSADGTRATPEDEMRKLKTKAGDRQLVGSPNTHGPERLQAFMLPNVVIDGETLPDALRKLMAAYEETCQRTGEHPLLLTFSIAPGDRKKLRVHLGIRNLNTSIRLLGTLAGMKVSRSGLEYRFEHAGDELQTIKRNLPLPANFEHLLKKMNGGSAGGTLAEQLARLGFKLDPATNLSLNGQDELSIVTESSADFSMISAMVKLLEEEPRVIQGFNARIIEIPADAKLETAESHWLDRNGVEQLMRGVSQTPGATVWEIPSSAALNGEPATFEIFNGTPYPTESEAGDVERGQGNLLRLRGGTLGFGNQLNVDFTSENRTMGVSPRNDGGIDDRVIIKDEKFHAESGTRIVVHSRADGSKVVLVVETKLRDAGGGQVR